MTTPDIATCVAAYEQTVRSTLDLARTFSDTDWQRPTRCPGWDVHDVVAHMVAVEAQLLGEPAPPEAPPAPHVRNDFGAHMERGVHARRGIPGPQLLGELETVLAGRLEQLRSTSPDEEVVGVGGMAQPLSRMLPIRVFDLWAHEQDVRAAVGRPGNLDTAPAEVTRRQVVSALPYLVVKKAGAQPGQSVLLDVTGAKPFRVAVVVGADGRAVSTDAGRLDGDATATVRVDWADLVARVCGREGAPATPAEIGGDTDLGERVIADIVITP